MWMVPKPFDNTLPELSDVPLVVTLTNNALALLKSKKNVYYSIKHFFHLSLLILLFFNIYYYYYYYINIL